MRGRTITVNAARIAEEMFGSHLFVNIFLVGVAWQGGYIPIRAESIEEAVRLNGVDVERNLQAFSAGRGYYDNPDLADVESPAAGESRPRHRLLQGIDRVSEQGLGETVARGSGPGARTLRPELADTVGTNLFKLMAYKDEYEVGAAC